MNEIRFSRGLSPWRVIARGLGTMVIMVTFVLMGDVVAIAEALTPLAFLLATPLALANALGYSELTTSIPRTGGAYVQVHEAQEEKWLSFLTGWVLVLASLGACGLLAHSFAVQVTTLLRDHLGLALPLWPWAAGLVVLSTINNALGTREQEREVLIAALIIVLLGFALMAVPDVKFSRYTRPHWHLGEPLTLLVVSFVGLEVVTNLRGEIKRRNRSISKTLLLTPSLALLLGAIIAGVAVGAVGPTPLANSPIPLALLGEHVAGAAGRPFILVVGAFALALAFNRALMVAVRQVYGMSADGFLPAALRRSPGFVSRRIQMQSGVPILLIALLGLLILPLTSIPMAFLARLSGLLYLLVLVVVNLTLARREQTESADFTLPFHPWIPALTLAIDALVVLWWGPLYLASTLGLLALGMLFFLTYARDRHIRAQEGVTVFKPSTEEREDVGYRVLVPIANPATAETLLHLAGVLAQQEEGEVVVLQVVTVPDQVPLEEGRHRAAASRVLLERALTQAHEEGFEMQVVTRVARSISQGILDTAREEGVDMILLGWRGYTRTFGATMGPIIDPVIQDAPCDVMVAKGRKWENVDKVLVPTAGGPNAPIAARLAWLISEVYGSEVTALNVQLGRATPRRMEENRRRIAQTLNGLDFSRPPEQKVVVAESVVEGIVREAEGYDLVLLGASEQGLFDEFVFGSIPQQIAARVPKTAVIVKSYAGPAERWSRKLMSSLAQLLPRLNVKEQLELRETMSDSARPGVSYFVLITLSCVIATLGLLLDSPAVVIGAMLVAPLMSPILGFSLGMVLGDVRLIRLSIEAVFKGITLAILVAIFTGILSPFKALTDEIVARTQPTLLDLAVALASGMAGAYALAREEVSAALPGVAIAAALMPPLSVVGLGLSLGKPQVVGGAFLLFVTNIAAISLAGVLIFLLLGIHPETWRPETRRRIRRGLVGFTLLLVVIAIPLTVIMSGIIQATARRQAIQDVLTEHIVAGREDLVEFEYQTRQDNLVVIATVRSDQAIAQEIVDATAAALRERLGQPVTLEVVPLPVMRSTRE